MPALATLCRSYSLRVSAAGVRGDTHSWVVWDCFEPYAPHGELRIGSRATIATGGPLTSEGRERGNRGSLSQVLRCGSRALAMESR